MTSTSAYLAACAAATQPLMRTFLFVATAVAIRVALSLSPVLDVLRRQARQVFQFLGLPAVQPLCDRERRVHPHHTRIEVQLGHALEAARGTLLDAHPAALAVIDQDLVEAVRAHGAYDARLGTDQIAVVAGVAGATAETAV